MKLYELVYDTKNQVDNLEQRIEELEEETKRLGALIEKLEEKANNGKFERNSMFM